MGIASPTDEPLSYAYLAQPGTDWRSLQNTSTVLGSMLERAMIKPSSIATRDADSVTRQRQEAIRVYAWEVLQ